MRTVAADGAGVGRDSPKRQPHAFEDAHVCGVHLLVACARGRDVTVKRISVLHREFAAPHHTEARPALISKLGLDVIEILRQGAVASQFLTGDVGDDFFAGRLNDEIAVVPVFDAQQFRAHLLEPAGFAPQLGRLDHRHQQLHRAGTIHLVANDRFDLAYHPKRNRHVGVDAGPEPLDVAATHHQLVAHDLGVRGGFLERGDEELTGFHGRDGLAGRARKPPGAAGNPRV